MESATKGLLTGLLAIAIICVLFFYNLSGPFTLKSHEGQELLTPRSVPQSPKKILIWAYPRTGSSFLGSILASAPDAYYWFEPLRFIENDIIGRHWQERTQSQIQKSIQGMVDCEQNSLSEITNGFHGLRTPERDCGKSTLRVIKTIRLHSPYLENWIKASDIKILHIVRDPRAIYSSMKKQRHLWDYALRDFRKVCNQIEDDMNMGMRLLPPERYYLMHYENLVDNLTHELKSIYEWLGVELTPATEKFAFEATHGGKSKIAEEEDEEYYLSVVRDIDFRHDSWKEHLTLEEIDSTETNCKEIMNKLGYKILVDKIISV